MRRARLDVLRAMLACFHVCVFEMCVRMQFAIYVCACMWRGFKDPRHHLCCIAAVAAVPAEAASAHQDDDTNTHTAHILTQTHTQTRERFAQVFTRSPDLRADILSMMTTELMALTICSPSSFCPQTELDCAMVHPVWFDAVVVVAADLCCYVMVGSSECVFVMHTHTLAVYELHLVLSYIRYEQHRSCYSFVYACSHSLYVVHVSRSVMQHIRGLG